MGRTVVIGGGIVGLLAAYELQRRGEEVTLLERGSPGGACSAGNLGWVVPAHSDPLPAPGLAWTSIRWMLRGDSPLFIYPPALPALAGWLWRFWRRCNPRDFARGSEALAALNRRTLELYDGLARDGLAFEMHRSRPMLVALARAEIEQALADFAIMKRWGHPDLERLEAREARALEPALSPEVAGALLFEEERHVRPETLCAGILAELPRRGVEVRSRVDVAQAERRGSRVTAVLAQGHRALQDPPASVARFEADRFLIAAGAWSGVLARRLGFHLPVQAGKGYSITLRRPGCRVQRPLYFHNYKAGCTPFDGALRVGGTMELSGINLRLDPRRVAGIRRVAERYLPGIFAQEAGEEWVGMRPITPDGLPLIGRAPGLDNVFVATGHGMLGVTLGPATGVAIADLMAAERGAEDLRAFDPGRF